MVCTNGYFDLNGVPDDGCEFQLEAVAVYVAQSDASAKDDAGCGGGPTATGGGRYPCKTIAQGLARAAVAGSGKTKVLVAGGAYNENVTLRSGISIYGGYNPVSWARSARANLTAIFGVQAAGHRKTVTADGITATTVFDGFTVYGQVASGVAENSYAIWVRASSGPAVVGPVRTAAAAPRVRAGAAAATASTPSSRPPPTDATRQRARRPRTPAARPGRTRVAARGRPAASAGRATAPTSTRARASARRRSSPRCRTTTTAAGWARGPAAARRGSEAATR
jgi:hypothetical protein